MNLVQESAVSQVTGELSLSEPHPASAAPTATTKRDLENFIRDPFFVILLLLRRAIYGNSVKL